ncbi:hypothetical protein SO694_0000565 [Aureococcus anophagefferens]|uniref:Uncharacterized protein n=1 Tax=Aureococcus anophagefferens TaxID=44056 RepID=A0ABR1G9L9_AURAN
MGVDSGSGRGGQRRARGRRRCRPASEGCPGRGRRSPGRACTSARPPAACAPGLGSKGCDIPNFKGFDLGRFPLVSADFWTSDHLSERSRSVGAVSETRAREHSR